MSLILVFISWLNRSKSINKRSYCPSAGAYVGIQMLHCIKEQRTKAYTKISAKNIHIIEFTIVIIVSQFIQVLSFSSQRTYITHLMNYFSPAYIHHNSSCFSQSSHPTKFHFSSSMIVLYFRPHLLLSYDFTSNTSFN